MPSARSLQGIDWTCRTYGPTLLIACGQPGKANTLANAQPITSAARLATVQAALDSFEAQAKTEYTGATWDPKWSPAWSKVFAEVWAQCPIPVAEITADPDRNAALALKTALRSFELNATQHLANGGVFP